MDGGPGSSHQLGAIQRFASRSGEWHAFVRRFETVLPTVLDDPTLAVFDRIPPAKRGSLQGVYKEMVEMFDPPSGARQKFKNCQRETSKSVLVFKMELLTLAEAAFPRLNETGLDSLVAEPFLAMAQKQDKCAGNDQPGSSASVCGRSDSGECRHLGHLAGTIHPRFTPSRISFL
ncbi:unnamed protein product [Lampetra fluviatilis]